MHILLKTQKWFEAAHFRSVDLFSKAGNSTVDMGGSLTYKQLETSSCGFFPISKAFCIISSHV